jgi:hypothetical protein
MRYPLGAAPRLMLSVLLCLLIAPLPAATGAEDHYSWRRIQAPGGAQGAVPSGTGQAFAELTPSRTPAGTAGTTDAAGSAGSRSGTTVLDWDTGAGKSYLIPGLELPAFLLLLNAYDRTVLHDKREPDGERTYTTNFSTAWDHLRKQNWKYDTDPFNVNQIGHPYQGATMYAIARSSGLGFWESLAYSNAGSFTWEMAGENSRPSINDLITTGNAGSLLGEALFRMSELVLKEDGPKPDAWHEVGAALLSPPTGFNRWAHGDRFKPIFTSHDPALFWRGRLGASISGNSEQAATVDF